MSHPTQPNFLLLYVREPKQSAVFFGRLLGLEPIEASPTFVMFKLDSGVMLGLWARHTVLPAAQAGAGAAGELAFAQPDKATVDALHALWLSQGVTVIQPPCALDFGYAFTAEDPDGHRLRVFAPGA